MKAVGLMLWAMLNCATAVAQLGAIYGRVTDQNGYPLPGVTVRLVGTPTGTLTDTTGTYALRPVPPGLYHPEASAVNYRKQSVTVEVIGTAPVRADFTLSEKVSELREVVVRGATEAQELARQPITITSLDARQLRGQALGVSEVLRRAAGVLVRRSGGLGSDVRINLNGLSGNTVRLYYDGIPLEYLGGGVEINNLPVNLIDRIDVYKGVMPVDVGTDALGGGLNIVPRQTVDDYLEGSYQLGSFNTHRATLMGLRRGSNGWFLGVNAFFNHSDNDYRMRNIPNRSFEVIENQRTGRRDTVPTETTVDARRFHDRHTSFFGELQGGVADRPWADRLVFASTFTGRSDQVQHGQRVTIRPAGEATRKVRSFIQRLKYDHTLSDRLSVTYWGLVSLTDERVDDTPEYLYDWSGRVLPLPVPGPEVLNRRSQRDGQQVATVHRLSGSYRLTNWLTARASNFFGYTRIRGEDPLGIRLPQGDQLVDPNTVPSHFSKNIFGAELAARGLRKKLSATTFYKNYRYRAESIDILRQNADRLLTRINEHGDHGYGLALKYDISDHTFVRTSYERTLRIPTEREIYGDFLTITPNYDLRPERSNNLNAGFSTRYDWGDTRFVSVDLNGFWRDTQDRIRLDVSGNGERARYINVREVASSGAELGVQARPLGTVQLSANVTYQSIALSAVDNVANEGFIGVQEPFVSDWFANAAVQYDRTSWFRSDDVLSVFWNYFFVNAFSVTYVLDPDRANPVNVVPTQHQHDAGISYAPGKRGFQFVFQVNNITNVNLYDNYRIPKPLRNFSFKINYSI